MSEDPIAQIRLAAARKTMNIDAPAVAEKTLQRCRAEDQQRIVDQRSVSFAGMKGGIDAALDQPRQGDAGEIGGDQRQDAEKYKPAVALDKKLNPVVIAKNFSVLWFVVYVGNAILPHHEVFHVLPHAHRELK